MKTIFEQHGFYKEHDNKTHDIGICPFCFKEKHFYINKETNQWDCKYCGKAGGYLTFLQEISEVSIRNFRGIKAKKLKENRGIRISTFRNHDVGFNSITGKYLLPIKNSEGKIFNIRTYEIGDKLYNTRGCKAGLYNSENLKDTTKKIWLCEGEWDTLVMDEILTKRKITTEILKMTGFRTFLEKTLMSYLTMTRQVRKDV
ncbi:hypothetical protein ACFL6K_03945 [Candidatus Latescibacterota bacterium]